MLQHGLGREIDGRRVQVADRHQKVPICAECKASLSGKNPQLPKKSLANDLWMGKLPAFLKNLSEGAWLLLARLRPFIHRYSCLNDSGKWMPREERIKAFIGNVCAFTQADGGKLLESLPPRAKDVITNIVIAFTGSNADLSSARLESLGVTLAEYQRAYEFFNAYCYVYAYVDWDDEAGTELEAKDLLRLPTQLSSCVFHRRGKKGKRVRQKGPADAVVSSRQHVRGRRVKNRPVKGGVLSESSSDSDDKPLSSYIASGRSGAAPFLSPSVKAKTVLVTDDDEDGVSSRMDAEPGNANATVADGSLMSDEESSGSNPHDPDYEGTESSESSGEEEKEQGEVSVAVADADLEMDLDRCAKHVEVLLRRQEIRKARILQHEAEMRASNPDVMSEYQNVGARAALQEEAASMCSDLKKMDLERMARDADIKEREVLGVRPPPGMHGAPGREGDNAASAAWLPTRSGELQMLVPTNNAMADMFDPQFWPAMDPRCFIYGDGVPGLDRDTKLRDGEYFRYLFHRDELEYDSIFDRPVASSDGAHVPAPTSHQSTRCEQELPRWRTARDL